MTSLSSSPKHSLFCSNSLPFLIFNHVLLLIILVKCSFLLICIHVIINIIFLIIIPFLLQFPLFFILLCKVFFFVFIRKWLCNSGEFGKEPISKQFWVKTQWIKPRDLTQCFNLSH